MVEHTTRFEVGEDGETVEFVRHTIGVERRSQVRLCATCLHWKGEGENEVTCPMAEMFQPDERLLDEQVCDKYDPAKSGKRRNIFLEVKRELDEKKRLAKAKIYYTLRFRSYNRELHTLVELPYFYPFKDAKLVNPSVGLYEIGYLWLGHKDFPQSRSGQLKWFKETLRTLEAWQQTSNGHMFDGRIVELIARDEDEEEEADLSYYLDYPKTSENGDAERTASGE